ncbi:hypothetical protein [Aeoliella mucimassa]|uniref:Carboxypeptidase regulatory-like domain-containing protein n=1 Tax=Aeoliella mucimassa TaxID=2527972 RepID=A0A518ALA9_9BACT|nr:hypothetical protein [Aeoliella mucimassa]QDU55507.1 hypothetical protein Pan181_16970 [Aeoliella mucimassa]
MRTIIMAVGVSLLPSLGCGGGPETAKVTGTVLLDGNPLSQGKVIFRPENGKVAEGEIASDGTFRLGTFSDSDGALLGKHKVAVMAYSKANWPPKYDQPDGSVDSGSLIPLFYTSPDSSGLEYDVESGGNDFTIELKSKN